MLNAFLIAMLLAGGEIVRNSGDTKPLPYDKYVRVVSEADSPVQQTYIKAKDGLYIAAAIRKPKGDGPFPALVMFHGAPGGRGMEQLVGWARGATGGPVWERFLQEGFVLVVADYRGGDMNATSVPADLRAANRHRRRPLGDRARAIPVVRRRVAHQPVRREPRRQPGSAPRLEGARD